MRDLQFVTPVKAKIGPPTAQCHQTQRLRACAGGHLLFETSQVMSGIPYADCFRCVCACLCARGFQSRRELLRGRGARDGQAAGGRRACPPTPAPTPHDPTPCTCSQRGGALGRRAAAHRLPRYRAPARAVQQGGWGSALLLLAAMQAPQPRQLQPPGIPLLLRALRWQRPQCQHLALQSTMWRKMIEKSTADTMRESLQDWRRMVRGGTPPRKQHL